MKKYILDEKFWHLSELQVDEFLKRYYQGEKCISLLKFFEINITPSALSKHLPYQVDESVTCPNCNAIVSTKYLRRGYDQAYQTRNQCTECEHIENHSCKCEFCQQKRIDAQAEQKLYVSNKIYEHCLASYASIEIQSATQLSLSNAMALLAIARTCNRLSETTYGALMESDIPFTPSGSFGLELMMSLIRKKLIRVSENSNHKHFTFDDDQVMPMYAYVNWEIQIENFDAIISEIENIGLTGNLPNAWLLEMSQFRKDLALAECKAFYTHCLDERKLPSEIGAKAVAMLLNILRDNSVAQCYQAIWNGAIRAIDFKSRQGKNSTHAANYMVGACLRYVDHARTEGWNTAGFQRNYNLPRSMISYVLYDVLLKIGERGFTEPYNSSIYKTYENWTEENNVNFN